MVSTKAVFERLYLRCQKFRATSLALWGKARLIHDHLWFDSIGTLLLIKLSTDTEWKSES